MNVKLAIVAALGLTFAAYLVFYVGYNEVLSAVLAAGWGGFLLLTAFALALFPVLGAAWHVLAGGDARHSFAAFLWGRFVRDSAAEILPFSQVGGFVIGARAAILKGIPAPLAFGSTIVDVSTEMMAQLAYVLLGIAFLTLHASELGVSSSLTGALLAGVSAAAIAGGIFILVQKKGLAITEKLATVWLPERLAHAKAVAASVDTIYRAPRRVWLSFLLHFLSWIGSAVLTWATFLLVGARIDLGSVIVIDSLVYAARSIAFVVPNALGVQEAAFALLSPLFGAGPELGLAVSLLKRARDVVIGVPVLIVWQAMEGKNALRDAALPGAE
jgi:glycosyltransferase 2 family protein